MQDYFSYRDFIVGDDNMTVSFRYTLVREGKTYEFNETLKFPLKLPDSDAIRASLRSLHLALGISYYKIFVSPVIKHPYAMSAEEAGFWNDVWQNGLGEFLYVNKLPKDRLAQFTAQDGKSYNLDHSWIPDQKALLGIGGGKDSIVAGELLKKLDLPLEGFVMATGEQLGQTKAVANTMEIGLQPIERILDKQLLDLQTHKDAYKGHVPISLIFGLVGTVTAIAQDASYVVVANESSASIPRVEWQGENVNHQWSKSFGFETKLQDYIRQFISPQLTYFSAIRQLSSVAIMRIFAQYPQYFEVFTSDNSVFRIDPSKRPNGRWSLESPKSLSSFILLAPWISEADMVRTFGRNFLNEASLEQLFYELIGLEGHQPLDCVGTEEELVLSLNLISRQGKFLNTALMKKAKERQVIADEDWDETLKESLKPSTEHAIPEKLHTSIQPLLASSMTTADKFKGKAIVFVGAGQGRAMSGVQNYFTKHDYILSFSSVDKRPGDDPLGFLKEYDPETTVFIKNEGIPGHEMPVPYLTQLQLFFELVSETGATVIGITGTKGKSTTASLTTHILKSAGRDAVLAGNIGVSPLEAIDSANKDTVFVLELSSYQLSDLQVSPQISACINLYNDHTDWHGSLESYWEAKHNIMRFAGRDDLFIFNPDFPVLREWAANAKCRTRPIKPDESYHFADAKIFGDHNRLNVLVAREIAREMGIDDSTTHQAVISFEPLRHRMQYVSSKLGVTYIDDAIGMTPESTLASMQAVTERYGPIGCLMLGGKDRGYDFTQLVEVIASHNIPVLILFPDTAAKIQAMLPDGYSPNILETSDMKSAVIHASQYAPKDSVVLLSTAAPSYSVWRDFEEKGNLFQEAISSL